jgi:hypothetical protein
MGSGTLLVISYLPPFLPANPLNCSMFLADTIIWHRTSAFMARSLRTNLFLKDYSKWKQFPVSPLTLCVWTKSFLSKTCEQRHFVPCAAILWAFSAMEQALSLLFWNNEASYVTYHVISKIVGWSQIQKLNGSWAGVGKKANEWNLWCNPFQERVWKVGWNYQKPGSLMWSLQDRQGVATQGSSLLNILYKAAVLENSWWVRSPLRNIFLPTSGIVRK